MKKVKKVILYVCITIDPAILERVKGLADNCRPKKSISAVIVAALEAFEKEATFLSKNIFPSIDNQ